MQEGGGGTVGLFLTGEARLEHDQVQQHDRHGDQGQDVGGRGLVGDQDHLLGRGDVQGEEQGARRHQEQFAEIGGLLLVRVAAAGLRTGAAELTPGQKGAHGAGDGLKRDHAQGLARRGIPFHHAEQDQQKGGGDEADRQGDGGVQGVVDQAAPL